MIKLISETNGVRNLHASGRVDIHTRIKQWLTDATIIDMGEVTFIDIPALSVLARSHGVILYNVSPTVDLTSTLLGVKLRTVNTEEEAYHHLLAMSTRVDVLPTVRINLRGRIDAFNVSDLRAEFDDLIDSGVSHYIVSLENVASLDSAGVAALVSLLKKSRAMGGDVALIYPHSQQAKRILDMTDIQGIFPSING